MDRDIHLPLFSPSDSVEIDVRAFLGGVRRGEGSAKGALNGGAEACADAFFQGAIAIFPDAASKPFLKTAARLWGKKMRSDERRQFSEDAGKRAGAIFRDDYDAGCAGGLAVSVLDAKLHIRSVEDYLAVQGWFLGILQFMTTHAREYDPETVKILRVNRSSMIYQSFHSGQPDYPEKMVQEAGAEVRDFDRRVDEMAAYDPETARILREDRGSVIYRTLNGGRLDYLKKVVEKIGEVVRDFDRKVGEMEASDPKTAGILRDYRGSVIHRALNGGQLDYPERFIRALSARPGLLSRI